MSNYLGNIDFVQTNKSCSKKHVIRLHFQRPPHAQSKLVSCVKGEILDVAVDLRKNSKTFGQYFSLIISEKNNKHLFIPKGFAHGFKVISDFAIVHYQVDNYYFRNEEEGIRWNSKIFNIDWKIDSKDVITSTKDNNFPDFNLLSSPF